ncbi:MAG: Membrane-bound lysozyme-inhibitor of c-type lysozyme [Cyanobacteriota bacterium]|jgi:membrane-bound inhibitor of C-type lysozyme
MKHVPRPGGGIAAAASLCTGWLAALPLPLAAESAMPSAATTAEEAVRVSYRCRGRFDAVDVTALFFNRVPAEVVLVVAETATRLPRVPAAGGSRYAAGTQSFSTRGEQASWRIGSAAAMACGPMPQRDR